VILYKQGMQVSAVCRRLDRSRAWFYKWLRRYESGDCRWSEAHSRAPHRVANKTPPELIQVVLHIRKELETTPERGIGAARIQTRMSDLEWDPLPKRTINRILKQHHAIRKNKHEKCRKQKRQKNKKTTEKSSVSDLRQLSLF